MDDPLGNSENVLRYEFAFHIHKSVTALKRVLIFRSSCIGFLITLFENLTSQLSNDPPLKLML